MKLPRPTIWPLNFTNYLTTHLQYAFFHKSPRRVHNSPAQCCTGCTTSSINNDWRFRTNACMHLEPTLRTFACSIFGYCAHPKDLLTPKGAKLYRPPTGTMNAAC